MHSLGEAAPHVEKLQAEGQARIAPKRVIAAKTQRLILIVAQGRHAGGHHVLGGLKGVAGKEPRLALEPSIVKRLWRPSAGCSRGLRSWRRGIGQIGAGELSG